MKEIYQPIFKKKTNNGAEHFCINNVSFGYVEDSMAKASVCNREQKGLKLQFRIKPKKSKTFLIKLIRYINLQMWITITQRSYREAQLILSTS